MNPTLPPLQQKFQETERSMATWNLERSDPIRTALLALVARQHCYAYGKPGIAKSHLVRTLHAHIADFGPGDWFQRLLTPFMTDSDLFGGIDMVALDKSIHRRRVEHKTLAVARIAFLDEIYKAGGPLLNTLLKALNEREFDNDETIQLPLWSCFAASNEFANSDELEALADRFTYWHIYEKLKDSSNFVQMLAMEENPVIVPTVSIADIETAQNEVIKVKVDNDVYDAMETLRVDLAKAGVEPTDRRFVTAIRTVRATAWMRGATVATVDDLAYTRFMFWRRPDEIALVNTHVLQLAAPLDAEALLLAEQRIMPLAASIRALLDNANDLAIQQRQKQSIVLHQQTLEAEKDINELAARIDQTGRSSAQLDKCRTILDNAQEQLLKEMFEIKKKKSGERNA